MREIDVNQLQPLPTTLGGGKVAVAIGGKGDPLAIGRPGGPEVAADTGGKWRGFMCRDVKNPEIGPARGTRRDEDDLAAVRGESGPIVERRVIGEAFQTRAVRMNAVEISRTGTL